VETPFVRRAFLAGRVLLGSNRIAFFDGPPGTGKTTTALALAARVERPVAVVTMSFRPAPLEVLRRVIEALTGAPGSGTKSAMEDDAVRLLQGWGGLLIVDEVQNCGAAGIQTLRYLHDRSGCTFAMLLVGWQALATIREHPDLQSRVITQLVFEPLSGTDLYTYLKACYPELGETPQAVLQRVNDTLAHGNLRDWRNFIETVHTTGMPTPLSRGNVDDLILLMRATS
jgi:DNA transposition AAA+ family ATPase